MLIKALKEIEQMSDTGNYALTIARMKGIATKALKGIQSTNQQKEYAKAVLEFAMDEQNDFRGMSADEIIELYEQKRL